ncbi:transglutaminase [candidate division KSB1 bacterium]|nr:transglutaminase [candidate division KSB1 bacterium]
MVKKLFIFTLLFFTACESPKSDTIQFPEITNPLTFYTTYGTYTDPGDYAYLYKSLPDSLTELCELLKCQFIHPVDIGPYRDVIPKNRYYEDDQFPTTEKLLAGLLALDERGLTFDRKPQNRLVVSCRYHALLLASILKYKGIPARLRYGYAPYLSRNKDLHIAHVICEVWNADEKRWMFVDPDRKMVDFPRDAFEPGSTVWLQLQNGESDKPEKYGVPGSWGEANILGSVCHDFYAVLGQELLYWQQPPLCGNEPDVIKKLDKAKSAVLTQIAQLMNNPDDHLNEIAAIVQQYGYLQIRE